MFIKTYTDLDFLKDIFENVPTFSIVDELINENENILPWQKLTEMIFQKCELNIKSNLHDFISVSKTNPLFAKIIDAQNNGKIKVLFSGQTPNLDNHKTPTSVHFTDIVPNQVNCALVSNSENWKLNILNLSISESIRVNEDIVLNDFNGWSFISNIKLPINSAIIVDRYILSNKTEVEKNLFSILRNLIVNSKGKEKFQLTIITHKNELFDDGKKVYDFIKQFLENNFPNKVEFGLVLPYKKVPHDRNLITNFYRIKSLNSFNFYKYDSSVKYNTEVEILPLNADKLKSLENILIELLESLENSQIIGHKRNRLFNLI